MSQMPALVGASVSFWEDLDEQTLGAPAAAVTFSGIDTAFTFLRLTIYGIKDAGNSIANITLNNDGGGNYEWQSVRGEAGVVTGQRAVAQSRIRITDDLVGGQEAFAEITIAKPLAAEEAQVVGLTSYEDTGGIALFSVGGQWNSLAALISRVDAILNAGNYDTGTTALLEGGKPA